MQQSTNTNTEKTKTNGKWAQHEISDKAQDLQEKARKIYGQAVEAGSEFVAKANKRVPELVREYPVYSTLFGICLGFLLGAGIVSATRRSGVMQGQDA